MLPSIPTSTSPSERTASGTRTVRQAAFFRKIVGTANEVVVIAERDGTVTYASDGYERFSGRPASEYVGKPLWIFTHPDFIEGARAAYLKFAGTEPGATVRFEGLHRANSGEWLHTENLARNLLDDPDVRGIVTIARDVTVRKKAEAELSDSERMYRGLFEGTSLAVTLRDVETMRFIDCNTAALRLYGYASREELIGTMPDELSATIQPGGKPSREAIREAVDGALRDGTFRTEWIIRRRSGELFPAELRLSVIALGGGRRVLQVVIEDVTERTRHVRAIEEQARRADLVSRVSRQFVDARLDVALPYALAALGDYLQADRVRMRHLVEGTETLETFHEWCAPGVPAHPVMRDDASKTVFRLILDLLRERGRIVVEDLEHLPDEIKAMRREVRPVSSTRALLYLPVSDQGAITGYIVVEQVRGPRYWSEEDVAVARLVTEIVSMGRARARAAEDAIAANLTKSAFLANMSHELRTPLNGVIGMVDLLAASELDDGQRRYTEIARSSAGLLLNVISDILDFSKIEAGRLELEATNVHMHDIVEEVASILALTAEDKGLELTCHSDSALAAPFVGDPARLRQVLVNLVSNAIKFTRQGEVSVRATVEGKEGGHRRMRVEVKDTGVGIPVDAQGKLFQPFTQVDPSTTRVHGGTGLGLAICRQLVERMGGSIGLESTPGSGATFWFEVPCEQAAKGADGRSPAPPEPGRILDEGRRDRHLAGLRVLAVDDNATNRELLQANLTAVGMLCDVAPDGPTALRMLAEAAGSRPYALAVLDHHMPGMDGREVARRIQADPRLSATRVVMAGSVASPLGLAERRADGIAGYISKPLWKKDLPRVLRAALDRVDGRTGHDLVTSSAPPTKREADVPAARVLIVEDSPVNAEVASAILRSAGYESDVAVDGEAAIAAVKGRRYDLVLMDVQLPEMDGYEATRRIRVLEQSGEVASAPGGVPIVALTASATTEDLERCRAAGMNDHISKPVDARRLRAMLAAKLLNGADAR
jgi:PAS domain S-box-containing protein